MYNIFRYMTELFSEIIIKKTDLNRMDEERLKKSKQQGDRQEKDKYVFSSVFPNEEIMNEVDRILREKKGA